MCLQSKKVFMGFRFGRILDLGDWERISGEYLRVFGWNRKTLYLLSENFDDLRVGSLWDKLTKYDTSLAFYSKLVNIKSKI